MAILGNAKLGELCLTCPRRILTAWDWKTTKDSKNESCESDPILLFSVELEKFEFF
jgi:hypothetical protein